MDELPIELIIKIFELINIKERIRLSCLSKRYKFIIDHCIKYNDLSVLGQKISYFVFKSDLYFPGFDIKWFISDKYMDLNNSIYLIKSNKHFFNSIILDRKFDNIQKLYVQLISDDLSFLSRFNRLDCLHIKIVNKLEKVSKSSIINELSKSSDCLYINNNNLTKLKIYVLDIIQYPIIYIDCSKLKYLCLCKRSDNIQFLNSNSVIYLKCQYTEYSNKNFLNCLPDLEVYEIHTNLTSFNLIDEFSEVINLIQKPNNKIRKIIIHRVGIDENEIKKLNSIKNSLGLELKKKIEIYINGLLLLGDDKNLINHIELKKSYFYWIEDKNLSILLDNCSYLLDYLPFTRKLDYSAYESKLLENKVPDCFINKLICLNELKINKKLIDLNGFFKFVSYLDRIYILIINDVRLLTNDFYSNLERYMPKLFELTINFPGKNFDNLDINFLLKLKCLKEIRIYTELKLNFIRDLFVNLDYLNSIRYKKTDKNGYLYMDAKTDSRESDHSVPNLITTITNFNKIKIYGSSRKLEFDSDYNFDLDPDKLYELYEKMYMI